MEQQIDVRVCLHPLPLSKISNCFKIWQYAFTMEQCSAMKRNKYWLTCHGWTSRALCYVRETLNNTMQTLYFLLHEVLEKAKLINSRKNNGIVITSEEWGQGLAGKMHEGTFKTHLDWGFGLTQGYRFVKAHQIVHFRLAPFIVCAFYLKLNWSFGRDLHAEMSDWRWTDACDFEVHHKLSLTDGQDRYIEDYMIKQTELKANCRI